MHSIRNKLFLRFGILIVFFVAMIILANSFILETYYTHQKKQKLIAYYNQINGMQADSYADKLNEFIDMESTSNIDILLKDKFGEITYTSNGYMLDERFRPEYLEKPVKLEPEINRPIGADAKIPVPILRREKINENIEFIWAQDDFNDALNLLLEGSLDNGYNIRMRLPLTSINATVEIVNQFILIIGGITFVLAMNVAFILSKTFTKPITEMNKVTLHLKKLNFDEACRTDAKDEIGQLAASINEMASVLKSTLESLHIRNEELNQEIVQKENINSKRQQLLLNVSHELKTPLSLLQGYAEGLSLNIAKDKDRVDFYCEVIIDEAKKMDKLVEGLLSINQLEFGDDPPIRESFDVARLVNYVIKKYEPVFQEKQMRYNVEMPTEAWAFADVFRTEQILTNYINNAIAYMDENKLLGIVLDRNKDHWRIRIINSGQAIPGNELEKVWDSFYKIDRARSREKGGHGLGLSIVRAIQMADDNAYGAENVEEGIAFWFEVDWDPTALLTE